MTSSYQQIVTDFFAALSGGRLPEELLTDDMNAWTTSSGAIDKRKFQGGVQMLGIIFGGTLRYSIDALTAEEDRVVAEVQSRGTLTNGEDFHNVHVFIFRIRDQRIAWVAEHMNPIIVNEKIVPLMLPLITKAAK